MKFLVDECLSPELAKMAHDRGHGESSHVVWLGKSGIKDWALIKLALDGDWTLVTKNSFDFRGPAEEPGSRGKYSKAAIHAGLVCLNGPPGMDLQMQRDLFAAALDEIESDDDLINKVLEASIADPDSDVIEISRYALPEAD
jgi:hypothetical protein